MRNRIALIGLGVAIAAGGGMALAADDSLKQVKGQKNVNYPTPETATAVCPGARGHVASGGWSTEFALPQGSGANMFAHGSFPEGDDVDEWSAQAHNRIAAHSGKLTSYGYCFNGKEPEIVENQVEVAAYPNGDAFTAASCPEGKTLIGGGYRISPDVDMQSLVQIGQINKPNSAEAFEVAVENEKDDAIDLTVYAVCGKGPEARPYTENTKIKEDKIGRVTAKCPDNKDFLFGGLSAEYKFENMTVFVIAHEKAGNGMRAEAMNFGSIPMTQKANLSVTAYCR